MARKTMEVETCDFCDEYKQIRDCSICGKRICPDHSKFIKFKVLLDDKVTQVCPDCQTQPFREVWSRLESATSSNTVKK